MHQELRDWLTQLKSSHPHRFKNQRVLEIGSLDINGSVRDYFEDCPEYIGVDLVDGPGVDLKCFAHLLDYPSGYFDVVISCECLEHDKYWSNTVDKMIQLCKPGGCIIISCATGNRPEHGTAKNRPGESGTTRFTELKDYYKNIEPECLRQVFVRNRETAFMDIRSDQDLYCYCNKELIREVDLTIPSWNNPNGCLEALESILNLDQYPKNIRVINDGSTADYSAVQDFCTENHLDYVYHKTNHGIYRTMNQVLRLPGWHYFMDDDIKVEGNILDQMRDAANEGYADPGYKRFFIGVQPRDVFNHSLILVNPEAIREVGLYDEHYFHHGGDFDMQFRAHYAGWPCKWIKHDTKTIHNHGTALRSMSAEKIERVRRDNEILNTKFSSRWHELFRAIAYGVDYHGTVRENSEHQPAYPVL